MNFQSIIKFIPSLSYSIVFLALFFWQFIYTYDFIIKYFIDAKILILHGYLLVYLFGIQVIAVSLINLLHKYLIHKKSFVVVTTTTLLIFYIFSFADFYHIMNYFIKYPLPYNSIMGIVFFILLALGYNIYSLVLLLFKESMPISHILVFLILGVGYSIGFIHYYCKSIF